MHEQINKLISYSPGGIVSKVLNKEGGMNVTLFCMAAGTELTEHTSTKQAFVYIIEGSGTFTLSGEDIAMAPGISIVMPPDTKHSLKATEHTSFLLILVK